MTDGVEPACERFQFSRGVAPVMLTVRVRPIRRVAIGVVGVAEREFISLSGDGREGLPDRARRYTVQVGAVHAPDGGPVGLNIHRSRA